jgi:hypothetical protein
VDVACSIIRVAPNTFCVLEHLDKDWEPIRATNGGAIVVTQAVAKPHASPVLTVPAAVTPPNFLELISLPQEPLHREPTLRLNYR